MNVPLKKRHIYGKLNGSASSQKSLNALSVKHLHSNSNYADSEYELQSSNMDDDSDINGPNTSGRTHLQRRKKQYLSIGNKAGPTDIPKIGGKSTNVSSSSSVILRSSASDHDSSQQNNDETTTSSSDTGTSKSSKTSDDDYCNEQNNCTPLSDHALIQHNTDFEPMNSKDRVDFWKISDEFSDIEDDFDDKKHFSKPIRSERIQRQLYNKPAPKVSTSTRKPKKTDEKPVNYVKEIFGKSPPKSVKSVKTSKSVKTTKTAKSMKTTKSVKTTKTAKSVKTRKSVKRVSKTAPIVVDEPIQQMNLGPKLIVAIDANESALIDTPESPPKQMTPILSRSFAKNSIVEVRDTTGTPSSIKFRVSYGKETNRESFKMPTPPNKSRDGCANCKAHAHSRHINDSVSTTSSSELPVIPSNNKEEFYKYLGIDTKPPQEKLSPDPSPTDNHRRSLRVFIQQRQNEFSRTETSKDDKPQRFKSPDTISPETNVNIQQKTPENGKISIKENGMIKLNSSNIKQRRSYEAKTEESIKLNDESANKETDMDCHPSNIDENHSNRFGECSTSITTAPPVPVRVQKRKVLLPSPIMLTEMLKRYRQCFKQGFGMRQYLRQQTTKRTKKRPSNSKQNSTADIEQINVADKNVDKQNEPMITTCEELINTFSPTSITHSNASTDSAIVVNSHLNEINCKPAAITLSATNSIQWQHDHTNHINKSQIKNPLNSKFGTVLAVLTHSNSPDDDDIIVVVQQKIISYWYSTSKILGLFGVAKTWNKIAEIQRIDEDIELNALYQHRLIDIGEKFPVYVELRARESPPDEFRQSYLTFVYLNVYYVKLNSDDQPEMFMERVNLDTLKGFANSIYYTALRSTPCIMMTWTEQNVNNQTRCGIVKYTLKTPTLDNIEEILDCSDLQHDIKTLYSINDYHVVGCGDRTVSMWDHRNGNLLIDIEIELPTIGQNLGCFTVGDDIPDYMLLVQLTPAEDIEDCENQLKVMAVQTVDPYNWRTLQTHNIPSSYGIIRSMFNNDDMLTITFTSGTILFLNILSPHKLYIRNKTRAIDQMKPPSQLNGVNITKSSDVLKAGQLFTQSNGQIIDITNHLITTKSVWEYFIDKD